MDAITPALQPPTVTTEQALTIKTTHTAGRATAEDSPVLHAAIGLAEQIRAASDEIERGRRIPPGIAAALKDAGVFGMPMPRAWGGPELDPLTQFRVIEALAMADGSVGWCAMIGCDGGYITAFLDQEIARTMYPDPLVATGAAATTTGKAIRVPRSPVVCHVSKISHCDSRRRHCRVSGTPLPSTLGTPFSSTVQPNQTHSQCWHPLTNGKRPLTR